MPTTIPITDPADPRVEVYRDQKDAWLRAGHRPENMAQGTGQTEGTTGTGLADGLFMAEGKLVLRQLADSPFEPESLLVHEAKLETIADEIERLGESTPVYVVSKETLTEICGFNMHRGILAAGRRGDPLTVAEVAGRSQILLVLEDLSNHDNVGGIFRSAAALAGPDRVGVLLSPRCCDPLYRKAIRVSMGWALRVPFATVDDWPKGLTDLEASGWTTIALTPGEGSVPIESLRDTPRPALLVGAEGPGLSQAALKAATVRSRIPIDGGVDSLNAMVAASIALSWVRGS